MAVMSGLSPSNVFSILSKYSKEHRNGVVPEGLWTTIASTVVLGSGRSLEMKYYQGYLAFRIGYYNIAESVPKFIEYKYPDEITLKRIKDIGVELGTYFRI